MRAMARRLPALIALLAASHAVQAAEYTAGYRVSVDGEHDDNVRLTEQDTQSISGASIAPGLKLGYRTADVTATLDTRLNFATYDESAYDSNDQRLQFDVNKTTPRNEFGLQAGMNRDSTRTSELEDTGRVSDEATRHEDYWFSPRWLTYIGKRDALQFGASAHDVSYDSRSYIDYTTGQGDITWLHILTPRTTLKLQAYFNRYEADNLLSTETDSTGLMAGGDYEVSKNLKLSGLVGISNVESNYDVPQGFPFVVNDSSDDVWVADTTLEYTQPRWKLALNLASQTFPSGDGYVQKRDYGRLSYSFRITDMATLRLAALYGQNESVDDRANVNRDYADGEAGLDWRINRSWYLTARYRYRFQDHETSPGDADSNAVFFGIRYEPTTKRWSR